MKTIADINSHIEGQLIDIHGDNQDTERLKPFLNWVRTEILKKKPDNGSQVAASVSGFITGGVGVYTLFPLGGDFANFLSDAMEIEDDAARASFYYLFAINAIIPMIALSGLATKDHFRNLATNKPQYPLVQKNNLPILRQGLKASAYLVGIFAPINGVYISCEVLGNSPIWLKVLMGIPAYLGCFMFKIDATLKFLNKFLDRASQGATPLIKKQRRELKEQLTANLLAISRMTESDFDATFKRTIEANFESAGAKDVNNQTLDRLRILLSPMNEGTELIKPVNRSQLNRAGKFIASTFGVTLGGLSGYSYFAYGQLAALAILSMLGIQDQRSREVLSTIIGSFVVIPWATLGANATQDRMEQIYDAIFNSPKKKAKTGPRNALKKTIFGYSIIGGAASAIPLTYLTILATGGMSMVIRSILIFAAFCGPTAVRSSAISRMLHNALSLYDSFGSDTKEKRSEKFNQSANLIQTSLDKLPDEQIQSLHNIFKPTENDLPGHPPVVTYKSGKIKQHSAIGNSQDSVLPKEDMMGKSLIFSGSFGSATDLIADNDIRGKKGWHKDSANNVEEPSENEGQYSELANENHRRSRCRDLCAIM